ncbi:MAG TPA: nicotinate (nicotinamide) nucleotide adenylyltransferase [Chitinophagaceae bacterium]|nr:nicotinate (nicotinamide) nucleotide adenylyltransferase [Chitinophagaceae bacterium]
MKIGLYFGSFNPIHTGHLIIANHILNETDLQKIWFVVSPQNPFKTNESLLHENKRLDLVKKSIADDERMMASDIEFNLSKPSYTINTLTYLQENYPDEEFFIVMGSDSFQGLYKWKNAETIIKEYKILIYQRPGFETENKLQAQIEVLNAPLLDISSTEIRELITKEKSIRYLVPDKARKEIEKKGYYKK